MKSIIKVVYKTVINTINLFVFIVLLCCTALAQEQKKVILHQAGYYQMQLGDFKVIALSDGTVPIDANKLMKYARPGEINDLLKKSFQTTPVEASINGFLVIVNNQLILIDAGTAGAYGPSAGHLTASLINAGYKPEQIDAILITHIHVDHTGGLMDSDKMVFPNATIYVSKPEIDFWLNEANKKKAPKAMLPFFEYAEKTIVPYRKAGKIKTFGYGKELFPGITPIATPGHTSGHTSYAIESKGQKLLFWGDITHIGAIQLADPSVSIEFDVYPKLAAITRKKVLAEAAKDGYWIAGSHLSFPGIGHLTAVGAKYTFEAIHYSTYGIGQ